MYWMGIKAFQAAQKKPSTKKTEREKERERAKEKKKWYTEAAAQVITKTEYKSKTLSMAFIIARFVGSVGNGKKLPVHCLDKWTSGLGHWHWHWHWFSDSPTVSGFVCEHWQWQPKKTTTTTLMRMFRCRTVEQSYEAWTAKLIECKINTKPI